MGFVIGSACPTQVAAWVATKILESEQITERVQVLRYFVDVAFRCYELRNFNTVTSIIAALESTPVHRMRKTWDIFARKHRTQMGYVGGSRASSALSSPFRRGGATHPRRRPLRRAWFLIPRPTTEMLTELLSARGNFSNYRKHLHSVSTPVGLALGLYPDRMSRA